MSDSRWDELVDAVKAEFTGNGKDAEWLVQTDEARRIIKSPAGRSDYGHVVSDDDLSSASFKHFASEYYNAWQLMERGKRAR